MTREIYRHMTRPGWALADWLALAFCVGFGSWFVYHETRPVTDWIELRAVYIDDPVAFGVDPAVHVDRVIHRSFDGGYDVIVRTEGNVTVCRGRRDLRYLDDSQLPNSGPGIQAGVPLLSWWAEDPDPGEGCDEIGHLPPGYYSAVTCHRVYLGGIFSTKERCVSSNVFRVLEEEGNQDDGKSDDQR